jgi:8-oxo-dGTP pyrophosphatase MutT (NUDIX family)
MTHTFRPSVTVAAIIEREGRFLLIEEETSDGIRLNQPAGHLDPYESLEQAVIREVLEETAHEFIPEGLVGMYISRYHSKSRGTDVTYLRFTFCGKAGKEYDRPLDDGILRTMWMTRDELAATRSATAARWCCAASTITWPASAPPWTCCTPTIPSS